MNVARCLIVVCALLVLGCNQPPTGAVTGAPPAASASPAASAHSGPPEKVAIGEIGSASDAGLYIAIDKGYFEEQNIEIERTRFTTAADMVPPLGLGQLDVGGGAPSAGLMNAIARDIPLKIVADKGNVNKGFGFQAILVRKELWDSGAVKGPADLKGRTIALNARDITPEVLFDRYLRSGGLTITDANVTTMGFPDMMAAFANGSIDAGLEIEPFVAQTLQNGSAEVLARADDVIPGQQVAVILYSPKFAQDRPDVARRFMVAYVKALRDYNDAFARGDQAKKTEIVDIIARNTPVKDTALYDKMVMPGLDPTGRVNTPSLDDSQGWWIDKGSQTTKADLSKLVDQSYVDYANSQLGPYR